MQRGFRTHLATLTTSLTEILERCKEHPLEEEDTVNLSNLLEQFNRKKEIISGLDEKILALTDEKDLEAEIVKSEEAINSISHHITQVKHLLRTSVSLSQKAATVAQSEEHSPLHSSKDKETVAGVAAWENVIQLPRLNIPMFAGDALSWEPFWDSFDTAVHSNSLL